MAAATARELQRLSAPAGAAVWADLARILPLGCAVRRTDGDDAVVLLPTCPKPSIRA
jgi:hypothetical protein